MQSKVKRVRTINNKIDAVNHKPVHLTLDAVRNEEGAVYGFAKTDDDQSAYIPARIVKLYRMQPEDGRAHAGFTAPLTHNARGIDNPDAPRWTVTAPVVWDGELQTLDVYEEGDQEQGPNIDEIETELVEFADMVDELMVSQQAELEKTVTMLKELDIKSAIGKVQSVAEKLSEFRTTIDKYAPENDE